MKYGCTMEDFVCCQSKKIEKFRRGIKYDWQFNYFFAKEVSEEEYTQIERGTLDSKDHGTEVINFIHPPRLH